MSNRQTVILSIILAFIVLTIGIIIGVFVKNFPIVEFDKKVSILGSFTFLLTLAIGVFFPFLIKKWIDDKQTIKIYLVKEIEELVKDISEIRSIIGQSHSNGDFTTEDRYNINFTFHNCESQIESIEKQFEVSFPKSNSLVEEMKNKFRQYKDYLTGGELMNSSFISVDLSFYRKHLTEYNKFESYLKEMIHKIHRI